VPTVGVIVKVPGLMAVVAAPAKVGAPESAPVVRTPLSVSPFTNPLSVAVKGAYTAPSYGLVLSSAFTVRLAGWTVNDRSTSSAGA
jgi:hypothetical protein